MVVLVPCQAQKVKPALKLTQGQTYYTISDISSAITQTFNGQEQNYNITASAKTSFKVLDIKDTVYNLEVKYENIGMRMQMPGMASALEFNSAKQDTLDIPSTVLKDMVNKPFFVSLSKTGRVLAVKNIENIMNGVFNSMTMDTTQKAQLKTQFMQSFGEKAFKGNLEQTMAIYPDAKVAKNDTWNVNTKAESVVALNVRSVYQLKDITDGYYLIHGDATMVMAGDAAIVQTNGMPIKYNLAGTITSDIKADKASGWIMEAKLKQNITGTLQIMDNPKVPGGMTVPMTIHTDIITTDR
jgi:hypothetical protein